MAAKPKTWSDTKLWKQLEQRARRRGNEHEAAQEILPQMTLWMDKIEKVLSQAHTGPPAFTLHDKDHSFRVAEWMYQLVRTTQWQHLSDYEVALLLLAAYLHDIGMSPELKKVTAIHRHILTGKKDSLTSEQIAELQRWLDENRYDFDLSKERLADTDALLDLADEITAYYVRHQHNEWSKEWIKANLSGGMHFLNDWRDLLILLCQSHHASHSDLRKSAFNPRPVGPQHPQRLNLRHLACILRVADILENSPDRVPSIIFQHRNIAAHPRSVLHWQLPHQLNIVLNNERICLSAFPTSAQAHKAILSLADAIDSELAGCAAIAESHHFDHCPGFTDVKREWFLHTSCSRLVQPKDNAYEYIEGAFRPNTTKLLQLLSGEQIYQTPLAAVRELLQNAFDAVREKIARKRLKLDNPADPEHEDDLGKHERVILTLIEDPDGTLRLTCQDSGCGMTKEIIAQHLLVSGDAHRPAIIELERECEKAGFHLNRTGQFGIGVLSYFMMAKSVSITTCRLQDCGDLDAPGWTFTTTGVGDFGELRKLPKSPETGTGSLIEWTLDKTKFSDAKKLREELEAYLRQTLIRISCTLRFQTQLQGEAETKQDIPAGWAYTPEQIKTFVTQDWSKLENKKLEVSLTERESFFAERQEFHKRLPGWLKEARESLRLSVREVSLPEGCGLIRVVLPWFELPEGPALAYVLRDRELGGRTFTDRPVLLARAIRDSAWKGMASAVQVQGGDEEDIVFFPLADDGALGWVECDFTHMPGRQLQVNRASLSVQSALAEQCNALVCQALAQMADDLLSQGQQPPFYGLLADVMLRRSPRVREGCAWFQRDGKGQHFSSLRLPCALNRNDILAGKNVLWQGRSVAVALSSTLGYGAGSYLIVLARPERVVAFGQFQRAACLWIMGQSPPPDDDSVFFPPQWQQVWSVDYAAYGVFFNQGHWAVRLIKLSRPNATLAVLIEQAVSLDQAASIHDPAVAALTLMKASWDLSEEKWQALQSRQPGLLPHLWQLCAEAAGQPNEELKLLCYDGQYWRCLTHDAFHRTNDPAVVATFLPEVTDPEWRLEVVEE